MSVVTRKLQSRGVADFLKAGGEVLARVKGFVDTIVTDLMKQKTLQLMNSQESGDTLGRSETVKWNAPPLLRKDRR